MTKLEAMLLNTRRMDGSFIQEKIPAAPGSRITRSLWQGDRGPFETKAVELVQAAREVDALLGDIAQAQDRIAGAKAKLAAAVKGWQTTLEQLVTTDPR